MHELAQDPFATKGIEYLLVICFLMAFVWFWRFLGRPAAAARALPGRSAAELSPSPWFHMPGGRFYHPGHCWAVPESDDVVRIGMDDFSQKLLGRPRTLRLPSVGSRVDQGENSVRLDIDSRSIDLLSPVGGEVIERNEEAIRSPAIINDDPYETGWLMKVRTTRLNANLKNLLSGNLARAWLDLNDRDLRKLMSGGEVGLALQDGGIPVSGIARSLSPERWEEIARGFLLTR